MSGENGLLLLKAQRVDDTSPVFERIFAEQWRERLLSFEYTTSLDSSPEATLTFSNRDLFWIDRNQWSGTNFPEEGLCGIAFQIGYPARDERGDRFTLPQFLSIVETAVNDDTFTIKCSADFLTNLSNRITQRIFAKQKISSIVAQVLEESGFDSQHRVIQDTSELVEGIAQNNFESNYAFIRRLAKALNYDFFHRSSNDGKGTAHFRKRGSNPSAAVQLPPGVLSFGVAVIGVLTGSVAVGAAYGTFGNGNTAPSVGDIIYTPSIFFPQPETDPEEQTPSRLVVRDIKRWNQTTKTRGKPAKVKAMGINILTGRVISEEVEQKDLDSLSLSRQSPYNVQFNQNLDRAHILESVPINSGSRDEKEARNLAKAGLESVQQEASILTIDLKGEPAFHAGDIWTLRGFAKFDGDVVIKRLTHRYGGGGFETIIETTTDGINQSGIGGTSGRSREENRGKQQNLVFNQDVTTARIIE